MPEPLPYGQLQTYVFLGHYIAEHGYAPSFQEIREACGLRSVGTVSYRMAQLERKGYIEIGRHRVRAVRLLVNVEIANAAAGDRAGGAQSEA